MTSEDHKNLANFVKSIHQKLRDESKTLGVEEAWHKHCCDRENLKQYASAMRSLATNHWEKSYAKSDRAISRVTWVHEFCQQYFTNEYLSKQRKKELEIANKIHVEIEKFNVDIERPKYKLLDVGSCYNPFKEYECFDVLPIDLAPATSDVYKCDFLNVTVDGSVRCVTDSLEIKLLQAESFHIIVFSLLLEYLPSPNQRLLCCKKAYELLQTEGILIIITPDSKHVGANAKIMKSWRFILSKIGFSRIKYEKLSYLHCMVFRKSLRIETAQRWASLQSKHDFYDDFVIPQDFKSSEKPAYQNCKDFSCDSDLFKELPLET